VFVFRINYKAPGDLEAHDSHGQVRVHKMSILRLNFKMTSTALKLPHHAH